MNSKDMELSNSVVSFSQSRKLKSIFNITSALTMFLFIILPFYVSDSGVLYGYKTFQLLSGLELFNSVGNGGYDLRWLVYIFQLYLLIDVLFSLISFRIFDLKVFYLTNLTRHTVKLFLSAALLAVCYLDQGTFVLNSLCFIVVIALIELIIDSIIRKRVYSRYHYEYPYRFMFFTNVVIGIFSILPLVKFKDFISMIVPTGSIDSTQTIIGAVGSVVFGVMFALLLVSVVFGIIFRSYVNKIESGFDLWRNIAMVIFFGIIITIVELSGSPEYTVLCFRVAAFMSFIQLIFVIATKINAKKAVRIYEMNVKQNPWIVKYEENTLYNVSMLPVSVALASVILCFVSVLNLSDGYSLYDLVVPSTSQNVIPFIGLGSVVEIVAFLTVLVCVSNFIISISTMFVKTNKLFEIIRFEIVLVLSIITYIVILTSTRYVHHWPMIVLIVLNFLMAAVPLLKRVKAGKEPAVKVQTNN